MPTTGCNNNNQAKARHDSVVAVSASLSTSGSVVAMRSSVLPPWRKPTPRAIVYKWERKRIKKNKKKRREQNCFRKRGEEGKRKRKKEGKELLQKKEEEKEYQPRLQTSILLG